MPKIIANAPAYSVYAQPRPTAIAGTVGLWIARIKQRRELLNMDIEQLADIGVSYRQATHEAAKPFWQA